MVGFGDIDGVLRQGALSPGVDAAYTVNVEVYVEVDESSALDFPRMGGGLQVLFTIVPSSDAEGLQANDAKRVLSVSDAKPAHITAVAVVLRTYILGLELAEGHLVFPEECGAFAVGIVLPRTSTVVLDVGVVGRQSHAHSYFGYDGGLSPFSGRGCGTVIQLYEDAALADGGVGHGDITDLSPCGSATCEACCSLVVVLRLPEIGLQRGLQDLLTIDYP